MLEWALSDAHSVLLILICVALIVVVTALNRARRAEIRRLQKEVKQLSQIVRELETAEQRRFILEIRSRSLGTAPSIAPAAEVTL
jgi:sensor domain CHASE-containing protein